MLIHIALRFRYPECLRITIPLDHHSMSHVQHRAIVGTDANFCSI